MFRGNKKLVYIFIALVTIIVLLQYLLPKPTDWSRNYQAKSKTPLGCYAIHRLMGKVYAPNLRTNNQTFYNLNNSYHKNTSVLIVNDKLSFNGNDLKALYQFLHKGNTVFMAAGSFEGELLDSLHLRMNYNFDFYLQTMDSMLNKSGATLRFFGSGLRKASYTYSRLASEAYFTGFDSARVKVLADLDWSKPCLISSRVGTGTLYLMSMPDVFANYFVAGHPNREAAYACLSLLKNNTLVWDEYYKTYNVTSQSSLQFIFQSDALYSAYLLFLAIIVFYMLFEGRRRQRVIPQVVPPINSTLSFVDVISHVYYAPGNHQSIAAERIRYFYETIRRKFRLDTGLPDASFYKQLEALSGIEYKQLERMFMYCDKLLKAEQVTEYELLELNRQLENFNKNSLR